MSVQLIAENILVSSDFYSATEQEGEYVGQPIPASANTGDFRLLTRGNIADFTYDGTATDDGTTTTIIDSVLCAFGDDYFIGATITFTDSGASPVGNTSGSKTITDFAQATGTLTWAGALTSTITGDTFTLTMPFATRDFRVALITAGDAGDATFKWAHDGGTTYLGRDDPDQATWLAQQTIYGVSITTSAVPYIVQTSDGALLCIFYDDNANVTRVYTSTRKMNFVIWSELVLGGLTADPVIGACVLSSGRILIACAAATDYIYYSDDNGANWSGVDTGVPDIGRLCELPNGNVLTVFTSGNKIYCRISSDGGFTWSSYIEVTGNTNSLNPHAIVAENGDVVCAFHTDQDAGGDYEIKCCISPDCGATWGSEIAVMNFVADITDPYLVKDIDGSLYCIANYDADYITFNRSINNGASWAARKTLHDIANNVVYPTIALADGHLMISAYCNDVDKKIYCVRRGIWEAYSANACPCAIEAIKQVFFSDTYCNIGIVWHGGAGDTEDNWQFEAKYDYRMANLIQDSPSKPWRSEQDNISCEIILDKGTYEACQIDGVGFFGCNLRTLDFDLDSAVTFDSGAGSPAPPSVDETVTFDLATGTVDDATLNAIQDTSLMANYKDHELAGRYYLRMTSGTDDGVTWKIRDNTGDYIFLETTAANNIAAGASPADTFVIFQKQMAHAFTNATPYRFSRIDIAAQHTAEDYYQIGTMVAGKTIILSKAWDVTYGKTHEYDIEMARTPHYGLIPIRGAGRRRRFNLTWTGVETTMEEVLAVLDHIEGKNIVLIPDSATPGDCYLVKLIGDVNLKHWFSNKFDMSFTLEEVL